MTTAAQLYREVLQGNHGRDVEFIANVILTSSSKPTTKLRNLLKRLAAGQEIRCGNTIDTIRVNGEQVSLSILEQAP
jgi:hypothetical protein